LLDFLEDAGLPFLGRLGSLLRSASFGLLLVSVAYGVATATLGGGMWNAESLWGGAIPSLVSAPLYALAWNSARNGRLAKSGFWLFAALFCLSTLASWPRGCFYPGWYAQPFLCLIASACLGIVPGLSLALIAACALALSPLSGDGLPGTVVDAEMWVHSISLMALSLASALTGVLLHKVLVAALEAGARHRIEKLDTARALRQSEKLLRHALRVDTVGDLAGLVSHQLRNAFQVMIGHVTLNTLDGEERSSERLRMVGDALMQSRPLLDQLMRLAHPDDGVAEECDLAAWMVEFAERAVRVMPSSVEVKFEPCTEKMPVQLDLRGLEHALWNLAINARHAMDNGGTLTIGATIDDGMACVSVKDTGCGIPHDLQQRIFDPYFTTKPVGQGTGLGLTAVARFVLSSQGRIDVESEQGKGAKFVLRFPLVPAAASGAALVESA